MGVGTAHNTFIVFSTGRLLFQVAKITISCIASANFVGLPGFTFLKR